MGSRRSLEPAMEALASTLAKQISNKAQEFQAWAQEEANVDLELIATLLEIVADVTQSLDNPEALQKAVMRVHQWVVKAVSTFVAGLGDQIRTSDAGQLIQLIGELLNIMAKVAAAMEDLEWEGIEQGSALASETAQKAIRDALDEYTKWAEATVEESTKWAQQELLSPLTDGVDQAKNVYQNVKEEVQELSEEVQEQINDIMQRFGFSGPSISFTARPESQLTSPGAGRDLVAILIVSTILLLLLITFIIIGYISLSDGMNLGHSAIAALGILGSAGGALIILLCNAAADPSGVDKV